nr:MAG TPA: hypothetical protein [Caudoviricetes sp.]
MKIIDNKKGTEFEISMSEFLQNFSEEVLSAEDRYNEQTAEGQAYIKGVLSGAIGDDLESPFYDDLVGNFNKYGDTWTSPRGVEQRYLLSDQKL